MRKMLPVGAWWCWSSVPVGPCCLWAFCLGICWLLTSEALGGLCKRLHISLGRRVGIGLLGTMGVMVEIGAHGLHRPCFPSCALLLCRPCRPGSVEMGHGACRGCGGCINEACASVLGLLVAALGLFVGTNDCFLQSSMGVGRMASQSPRGMGR